MRRSIQQHFEALIIEERIKCAFCPFFFITLERGLLDLLERRGFFCAFFCVCFVFVCVFFCRGTFSVLGGETTVLKSSQKNRIIIFSLNQNRRHVQPSRVLRHGNRRATGRTHRNDGASSRKHSFSFSREEHHYSKRSLLLLMR